MSYLFLVGYFVNALFASTNWRLSPHMVLIECILSVLYSKYGLRCAATEVQGKRWDLLSDGLDICSFLVMRSLKWSYFLLLFEAILILLKIIKCRSSSGVILVIGE